MQVTSRNVFSDRGVDYVEACGPLVGPVVVVALSAVRGKLAKTQGQKNASYVFLLILACILPVIIERLSGTYRRKVREQNERKDLFRRLSKLHDLLLEDRRELNMGAELGSRVDVITERLMGLDLNRYYVFQLENLEASVLRLHGALLEMSDLDHQGAINEAEFIIDNFPETYR